ncbi:MAG: phosphoribosylaminoimidazolesuccinocarboxamide synthase [Chloracidobacterium sp.]|nr:phosphoribosylaminoimidazolesuccinocarboxamide synthase [Chloracidobacterium sp.]
MTGVNTIFESEIPGLHLLHRGKVRDVYEIDEDRLLLVTSDRISAFDCILPTLIPQKGVVLTQISAFWFDRLQSIVKNHLISANFDEITEIPDGHEELRGRSTLARRTQVFPVECVVRGFLEGSAWKDYLATGSVCGHELPPGLQQCEMLPEPIFTPATKAATGHDENIDFNFFCDIVGPETGRRLRDLSLEIYTAASMFASQTGIIIADTKFEFGRDRDGNVMLIDEVLTPDSSRFWAAKTYEPGHAQPSFDKQFVREYLETLDWDKTPPAPHLPNEVVAATSQRYLQAYKLLTGHDLTEI